MKYFFITGTSRGIGEELANQLLAEDHHLFCLSRTENEQLIERSIQKKTSMTYYPFDLNHLLHIEHMFTALFSMIPQDTEITGLYLINNAGMLAPVAPIEQNSAQSIIENVNINLLAPMIITANFLKHARDYQVDKRIMNISSGSARYLLPSQSCYSTSKAGLDSFSKSVSLEQLIQPHPAKVVSVYPGMIDTQLQAEIRSASKADFPYVDQFIQIAEEGKLQTPDYTAAKLIALLFSEDFGSTVVVENL
ncbi:benzil reductase ((S)-benzoin forming) [Paenibacillus algorifonticola]|uniref:Benzil reductase ((S)-benzoin forming) n=1 Tax=Paenibacillus algorifonticola TaxID=684063 RepID=A0A1I2HMQ2_9BACL|nr:(S)-benzoin forming benzil reductase [Paenibacillus algorifonticola]SFF31394.1 benzil reductase ((S)-benzoin forming) [Paenibacillus algorifonticola]